MQTRNYIAEQLSSNYTCSKTSWLLPGTIHNSTTNRDQNPRVIKPQIVSLPSDPPRTFKKEELAGEIQLHAEHMSDLPGSFLREVFVTGTHLLSPSIPIKIPPHSDNFYQIPAIISQLIFTLFFDTASTLVTSISYIILSFVYLISIFILFFTLHFC